MIRVPALYLRSWQLSASVCSSFLSKPEKSSTRANVSSCIIWDLLFLRIISRGYQVSVPVSLQDLFYHNHSNKPIETFFPFLPPTHSTHSIITNTLTNLSS